MIRLFFIKNKLKNKNLINNSDEKILEKYFKNIENKDEYGKSETFDIDFQ